MILFLDFDGVLNTPKSWGKWRNDDGSVSPPLESDLVARLKEIVEKHDLEVVVSSTWRNVIDRAETVKHLGDWVDGRINRDETWRTGSGADGHRGLQIKQYLVERFGTSEMPYLILDDDTDFESDQPHVHTDYKVGLSLNNMKEIDRIVSLADRPKKVHNP